MAAARQRRPSPPPGGRGASHLAASALLPNQSVVEAGIAQGQTAAVYLKYLTSARLLKEVKVGREKLFINLRLMWLLTAEVPGDLKSDCLSRETGVTGRSEVR